MTQNSTRTSGYIYQISIIGLLFFIFGFITWLNGTLIPFLKLACELDTLQALLVTFAFYMSYFFLALPSSEILKRTGFKQGMAVGLVVMAVGCLIFIPAANTRSFPLFLTGLFVQGMGLSLLQTASNPYISILGPIESAAQRISIMGICNKFAGILSPLILSTIVLSDANRIESEVARALDVAKRAVLLDALAARVVMPYVVMAAVLAILAWMISKSALPEVDLERQDAGRDSTDSRGINQIWQFPQLYLGALAIFFYVGSEVMAGDGIGIYAKSLGYALDQTKYFTSLTLAAMLVGYVLGIVLIPKYLSQQIFLKLSAGLGLILTAVVYFSEGGIAVGCIAALGLANAVMWPAIFPIAISGLGRFTQTGSALLIMGICGGAILPQLYGLLESRIGYQAAFQTVMLPCYGYILYYAMRSDRWTSVTP
jgi:glucose/galactose transporter